MQEDQGYIVADCPCLAAAVLVVLSSTHHNPTDLPSPSTTPLPQDASKHHPLNQASTVRAALSSSSHECPRRDHLADYQPPVLLLQIQVRSKWSMLLLPSPPSLPPPLLSRPTPTPQTQCIVSSLLQILPLLLLYALSHQSSLCAQTHPHPSPTFPFLPESTPKNKPFAVTPTTSRASASVPPAR